MVNLGPRLIGKRDMKTRTTDIIDALRRKAGLIHLAAQDLGVSRDRLAKRIKRSAALQAVIREIREASLDIAEAKLTDLVLRGDPASVRFYLERLGKDRGYGNRTEVTGRDGGPINLEAQLASLTNEQTDLLERIIQAGGGGPEKP